MPCFGNLMIPYANISGLYHYIPLSWDFIPSFWISVEIHDCPGTPIFTWKTKPQMAGTAEGDQEQQISSVMQLDEMLTKAQAQLDAFGVGSILKGFGQFGLSCKYFY